MVIMNLKVIFVPMLVMCSDALTVNLTYTPSPALENSPLTLTCSYTGLQVNETLSRTTWTVMAPNELVITAGRIILPACSAFGPVNSTLYSFSCADGYINWTVRNINRSNNKDKWECTIVSTHQTVKASSALIVQVPITSVSLTEPTDSIVTINAGTSKTFICRTSGGLPQATIKWFKVTGDTCSQSGSEIVSSVSSPTVSVLDGLKLVESTMTFTASGSDNGLRICCSASNVAMMQRLSGTKMLHVRYAPSDPPDIEGYASGSTYNMIENSTESLTCSSTGGNPLASITWSCFNGQMSSSTEQGSTVKRAIQWTSRRNENARCTCTASHVTRPNHHQSAFVNVNILYPPSTPLFRVANTDVGTSIRILTDSSQTVECTSSGNPPPTSTDFTWRKGTNVVSTGPVLNWQGGFKVGDEGSYTCIVETTLTPSDQREDAEIATSSSVEITVLYPPELPTLHLGSRSGPVIDGPLTLVVQRPFTFACTASSKPPANYTWTGGVKDVQDQLLHDTLTARVNTMRTCTAWSTLNPTVGAARTMSSSATVTININYSPEHVSIMHGSVSETVILSEFKVIEGNATKLYCSAQSQPASSFTWSGTGMHSLGSNLVYSNTLRSQVGILSCLAENNMTHGNQVVKGSASRNISLNVLYPPKLRTLHRKNAVEGSSLLIQCQYTAGNPKETRSAITRTADGTSWSGDHLIQSIRRADAGLYRCTVVNAMDPTGADVHVGRDTAEFDINVWYNTSITRFEVSALPNKNKVIINESDRFVLVCEVLSNPKSTIRLKQNHIATTLLERENVLEVQYVILSVVCSDAAVYTCSGFNNYTDMEHTPSKELQLFVRCSPRPSDSHERLKRNFTGTLHGNVTFSFWAVAYPLPMFEWQMWNGTSYSKVHGGKYVITSSDLFTSLTILNIQRNDFVSFILKVSNGIHPYLQETFYLNPQDVPKCPTNFTLQSKSTTMATVQWKGEFNGGLRQTFVLVYKKRSDSKYITHFKPEDEQILIYSTEIKDLEDGHLYDVILYSQNEIGPCKENKSLEFSTETDAEETTQSHAAVIGGVVGGSLGVVVAVIILVLVLRRKYTLNCVCKIFLSRKEEIDSDQNGHGADNPGYNAAETYEVVSTAKETPTYDALNVANDRLDNSHLYTPLDDFNSKSHINYENVKREDPVYNNTVLQNPV